MHNNLAEQRSDTLRPVNNGTGAALATFPESMHAFYGIERD
jgi:hypothetical protein